MSSIISFMMIITLITVISLLISSRLEKVENYRFVIFEERKFNTAFWLYIVLGVFSIISIFPFYLGVEIALSRGIDTGFFITFVISLFLTSIAFYSFVRLPKMYVKIDGEFLYYFDGKKLKINLSLNEVRSVYSSNGYVVIDVGTKQKVVIPLCFSNITLMIAMIRYFRK